jgi:hypothetical protein
MGVPAEWRHNKAGLIKKMAVAAVIVGGTAGLVMARRSANRSKQADA